MLNFAFKKVSYVSTRKKAQQCLSSNLFSQPAINFFVLFLQIGTAPFSVDMVDNVMAGWDRADNGEDNGGRLGDNGSLTAADRCMGSAAAAAAEMDQNGNSPPSPSSQEESPSKLPSHSAPVIMGVLSKTPSGISNGFSTGAPSQSPFDFETEDVSEVLANLDGLDQGLACLV